MAPPIVVRGARTHNLKSVDVEIPTDAIVVITGPSGAGKSSLAFDTIFAEAQRRYLEALSGEVRLGGARLPRPDVDVIEGLPPAIAIDQRALTRSSRSTIGTITEITEHLRVLYARVGTPHCPICGDVVRAETPQEIVEELLTEPLGTKVIVRAPILRNAPGDLRDALDRLRKDGYVRAIVDDKPIDLGEVTTVDKKRSHDLDAVIDRIVIKEGLRARASDSIELALRLGGGRVRLQRERPDGTRALTWHSQRFACEKDDFVFPPIEPALFSFNAPDGACPDCEGLGVRVLATERTLVIDPKLTLRKGAITAWGAPSSVAHAVELKRAVDALGLNPDVPFEQLPEKAALLSGTAVLSPARHSPARKQGGTKKRPYEGVVTWIESRLGEDDDDLDDGALDASSLARLREEVPCATCNGTRLRVEARSVEIAGRSISDIGALPLSEARTVILAMADTIPQRAIGKPLIDGALSRLDALLEIGLGYLSLDRRTDSLSAGEGERARIAGQLAGGLRGVLYVLDEPSRGMHAHDTDRLRIVLERLRARGSTVLLVEHDLGLIRGADYLIDVGPIAGVGGGRIVARGTPSEIASDPNSVTGPWLVGKALPRVKRVAGDGTLAITGVTLRNLRDVTLKLPRAALTCVTGPSGSGKSSLILDALVPAVRAALDRAPLPRHVRSIDGVEKIERVVAIDQSPLGRTARSNATTAVGIMPKLRELFAALPEAKARGYKAARFSTNVKGGRCEACQGEGVLRVEMRLLPDVTVPCTVCRGARYDRETLEVKWRGMSIADVLATSVDDAQRFFESITPIRERLDAMRSLGLGYLPLGQPSTTLSGGEAQRVKLARELAKGARTQALYVLDEPTAGLHPNDISVLLEALVALRDQGNTVVIVEHDLALAARADHVIDLGPAAGDEGGRIVAEGPPEIVARSTSVTAEPLLRALQPKR